jgi:hypothetical protein
VFVALRSVLVYEAVPEFHKTDFLWCAVREVFQGLLVRKGILEVHDWWGEYLFVFDHKPVLGDLVFCFREFFVRANFAFTSTSVEFADCRSFESSSLSGVRYDRYKRYTLGQFRGSECVLQTSVSPRSLVLMSNCVSKDLGKRLTCPLTRQI